VAPGADLEGDFVDHERVDQLLLGQSGVHDALAVGVARDVYREAGH
jgi:hypothetical protein